MIRFPWRSKVAAVIVLFFLGTFAGQLRSVLDTVRGRVEDGARITGELRSTVSTIRQLDTSVLEAQVADLQARLTAGTATPADVRRLESLVRSRTGTSGVQGPPGPAGPSGPPGPPTTASPPSTTTTTRGGVTTTTRPPNSTTTTTRPPTTTTTRCVVGVGRLVKVGC